MAEFDIIQRYFTRAGSAGVHLGIGDDAALITPDLAAADDDEQCLAVATDTLNEGVHFLPDTPAFDLGHRVLAVNLSDMAAMGARPRWAQLALTLPQVDQSWLARFAEGFFSLAEQHQVSLSGGDTTRGPLAMTVTIIGTVPCAGALTRGAANAGEQVYVTGWPGEAAAGLALSRERALAGSPGIAAARQHLRRRFSRPQPRVEFALALRRQGLASAAIDVSDGLLGDADKLARASGVCLRIQQSRLPCSDALLQVMARDAALGLIQAGGDDYELLFTAAPAAAPAIAALAEQSGLACTCIGEVVACAAGAERASAVGVYDGDRAIDVNQLGYEHFNS